MEELLCCDGGGRRDPLTLFRRREFLNMVERIMEAKERAEMDRQREAADGQPTQS